MYGNVRSAPLTWATATDGGVLSTITVWAAEVALLPTPSDWLAATVEVPSVLIGVVSVAVHAPLEQVPRSPRRCR